MWHRHQRSALCFGLVALIFTFIQGSTRSFSTATKEVQSKRRPVASQKTQWNLLLLLSVTTASSPLCTDYWPRLSCSGHTTDHVSMSTTDGSVHGQQLDYWTQSIALTSLFAFICWRWKLSITSVKCCSLRQLMSWTHSHRSQHSPMNCSDCVQMSVSLHLLLWLSHWHSSRLSTASCRLNVNGRSHDDLTQLSNCSRSTIAVSTPKIRFYFPVLDRLVCEVKERTLTRWRIWLVKNVAALGNNGCRSPLAAPGECPHGWWGCSGGCLIIWYLPLQPLTVCCVTRTSCAISTQFC